LLFGAELTLISAFVDGANFVEKTGWIGRVFGEGAWLLRFIIGFAALFVTFAYLKSKVALESISKHITQLPVRNGLLAAHFFALATFGALSSRLYGTRPAGAHFDLIAFAWFAAGMLAIGLASLAFLPLEWWARVIRSTGSLPLYA